MFLISSTMPGLCYHYTSKQNVVVFSWWSVLYYVKATQPAGAGAAAYLPLFDHNVTRNRAETQAGLVLPPSRKSPGGDRHIEVVTAKSILFML